MNDEQKRIVDRWTDNSNGYCYNPRAMVAELLEVASKPVADQVILRSIYDMVYAHESSFKAFAADIHALLASTASEGAHIAAPASAEPVGIAGSMPGTEGFTMAAFKAEDVPIGTELYTRPIEAPDNSQPRVDDLRMLVQRLVHALNKASPGNDLGAKALDYLMRNGLGAQVLRNEAPDNSQAVALSETRADIAADRHFINGVKLGWNFRDANDEKGFQACIEGRAKQIQDARAALSAPANKEPVYREAGVWAPDGSKFMTYRKENLNGKSMYVRESK